MFINLESGRIPLTSHLVLSEPGNATWLSSGQNPSPKGRAVLPSWLSELLCPGCPRAH